jgi:hypothetical protein
MALKDQTGIELQPGDSVYCYPRFDTEDSVYPKPDTECIGIILQSDDCYLSRSFKDVLNEPSEVECPYVPILILYDRENLLKPGRIYKIRARFLLFVHRPPQPASQVAEEGSDDLPF